HGALDFCGTTHGFDRACELDQRPVSGRLDDAAAMLVDFRINKSSAKLFQRGEGALLVLPHQPAVARHIGRENSREPSLYPLTGHIASTKHQVSTYGQACERPWQTLTRRRSARAANKLDYRSVRRARVQADSVYPSTRHLQVRFRGAD